MLDIVQKAAKAGGAEVKKYFGSVLDVSQKTSATDLRTNADLAAEKAILTILQASFPDANYVAEEEGNTIGKSPYTFVIDPLDGTHNFSLGIPDFAVSIAVLEGDKIKLGVIYQPITDQLYYAERGQGAYCNDVSITTNQKASLSEAMISYVGGYHTTNEGVASVFDVYMKNDMKRFLWRWAAAMDFCLLASGSLDTFICSHAESYDCLAGKIIMKEAGAVMTQLNGEPEETETATTFLVSSNEGLHQEVVEVIAPVVSRFRLRPND